MHPALWISKTGLDALQTKMNVISNNLANASTVGYKQGRAVFEDLMYQTINQPGGMTSQESSFPTGSMIGTGVKNVAVQKTFEQGGSIATDNPTDIMINGQGFLQVLLPDGSVGYTRDGQMQKNSEGQLVTSKGYVVQPSITIPEGATSLTIGMDGVVSVTTGNSNETVVVGNIELAHFINPAGLQPKGENLYLETTASGSATTGSPGSNGFGTVIQNTLEGSNVNIVKEMISLIETQRAYELNSKAIATVDSMLQFVAQTM